MAESQAAAHDGTPCGAAPSPCCTPARAAGAAPLDRDPAAAHVASAVVQPGSVAMDGMVLLPGGEFLMGTNEPGHYPDDGEGPVRRIALHPFWIDPTTVSNAQFAA